MDFFSRAVRRLAALGIALAALTLIASMLLVTYAVVMRYFLNQPPPWVDEAVGYLLVATVMLAAANALLQGEHIAIDILPERLGVRVGDSEGVADGAVGGTAPALGGLV